MRNRRPLPAIIAIVCIAIVIDLVLISGRAGRQAPALSPVLPRDATLNELTALVREHPRDPALHLNLAKLLLHFRHYLSAREQFTLALDCGANEWDARSGLAACENALLWYDAAAADITRLVQLRPRRLESNLLLADVLQSGDNETAARTVLDKAPRDGTGMAISDSGIDTFAATELLATAYGHLGAWNTSIDLLRTSLGRDPQRVSAKAVMGKALCESGRKVDAIPYLISAAKDNPKSAEIMYLLGICFRERNQAGDSDRALGFLRTAVGLDDKHGAATLALAQELDRRKFKPAAAFGYYRASKLGMEGGRPLLRSGQLLLECGNREEGWYRTGLFYESIGRPDLALAEYTKLTTLHNCCRSGYIHMARAYTGMGNANAALKFLRKAQALEPARASQLDWKVIEAYSATKDDSASVNLLRRMMTEKGSDADEARFQLARIYRSAGKYSEAETLLADCARSQPNDAVFHTELGRIRLEQRGEPAKLRSATTELEKAVMLAPENYDAVYGLGLAYSYEQDYDRAVETLRHAIDLRPENGDAFQSLSQALARANKKSEATEMLALFRRYQDFRQTRDNLAARCKRDPANPALQLKLAEFHMNAHEYSAAISRYQKVLALQPGNEAVRAKLAEALGYLGRREEQREVLALAKARS